MLRQLQDSASAWYTDAAVRDTIAAIARNTAYNRDIGRSAWNRAVRWIWDLLDSFFTAVSGAPYGRAITITLLVLAVLLIVARVVIGVRAEHMTRRAAPRSREAKTSLAALLGEAERLALNGEYTAAAHALFAVLLSAGAARGEFRVHPSKTTGDYVGELRRRNAEWLRPFQAFRARYDRVMYGDMQCSRDDYLALSHEARVMLSRDTAA